MTELPYIISRNDRGFIQKTEVDLRSSRLVVPFPDGGTSITISVSNGRLTLFASGQDASGIVVHPVATEDGLANTIVVEPAQRFDQECRRDALKYD